jgi:hypothetical protein
MAMKINSLSLVVFALTALPATAGEIYVIAHPALEITVDAVRDVFVGEKQFQSGVKLAAIDNLSGQKEFLEKVMKLDSVRYGNIWTKKSFRDGLNAPPSRGNDAEVLAFVRANAGAVGYVTTPPAGVKTIGKF